MSEEPEGRPYVSVRIERCDACYSEEKKRGATVSLSGRHQHLCGRCLLNMIRRLLVPEASR